MGSNSSAAGTQEPTPGVGAPTPWSPKSQLVDHAQIQSRKATSLDPSSQSRTPRHEKWGPIPRQAARFSPTFARSWRQHPSRVEMIPSLLTPLSYPWKMETLHTMLEVREERANCTVGGSSIIHRPTPVLPAPWVRNLNSSLQLCTAETELVLRTATNPGMISRSSPRGRVAHLEKLNTHAPYTVCYRACSG